MLADLDTIPWSSLHHAYGEASDVPRALRALAEGDDGALGELFSTIWHQGTVYEATAPAVPFLLEILDQPETDAIGILKLLENIAQGQSYHHVHAALASPSEVSSPEYRAQVTTELGWVEAARRAVRAGESTLFRAMNSEDEDTRAAAALVIGACAEKDEARDRTLREALASMIETEKSSMVRAGMIFALTQLGGSTEAWLSDPDPAPRIAAALGRARQGLATSEELAVVASDLPDAIEDLKLLPMEIDEPLAFAIDCVPGLWEVKARWVAQWATHPNAQVRASAVFAADQLLQTSRAATRPLIPVLIQCAKDSAREVRRTAIRLLSSLDMLAEPARELAWEILSTEKLAHNQPSAHALKILCTLQDPRAAAVVADALAAVMSTPDDSQRKRAPKIPEGVVPCLELLGPWAPQCLPALIRLIPIATAGNTRISVIAAVGQYGSAAVQAIPLIRADLPNHPHIGTTVLGDFGPLAHEAFEDLLPYLNHEDAWVRGNAARARFKIKGDRDGLVTTLRGLLSGDNHAQSHALEIMAEVGSAVRELVDLIPPFFESENDWLSSRGCIAYYRVTGDASRVLSTLVERHIVGAPRGAEVVACLRDMGAKAKAALPKLEEVVSSDDRVGGSGGDQSVESDETFRAACAAAIACIRA